MGWRTQMFGVEHPTRARRAIMLGLYAFLALTFYGLAADILPEPAWATAMLWLASVPAVAATAWLGWFTLSGRNAAFSGSRWRLVWMLPVAAVVLWGFMWVVLARAVPGAVTRAFGAEVTLAPAVMWTDGRYRKGECDNQLRGGVLGGFLQGHLCVQQDYFDAHPDHRVEVRLVGRRSALGFAPTGFLHLRDLGPRRRD